MRLRAVLISLIAIVYIGCPGPVGPPPEPPGPPPPGERPVDPPTSPDVDPGLVEVELFDEALALDATGAQIVVLGRRSFWVFGQDGRVSGAADLTAQVPAAEPLPRRAAGQIASSGDDSWDVWSTLLGSRQVLRLSLDPDGRPQPEPADVDPPEDAATGIARGWPGPVVETVSAGEPTFFHLDAGGQLVAESEDGTVRDRIGPVGEPLAVLPAAGGAHVYVSAAAPPGDPDRLIEYGWDGTSLTERRRSREFDGRVVAVGFRGGTAIVAVVDWPGHTRLFFLSESELWAAGS